MAARMVSVARCKGFEGHDLCVYGPALSAIIVCRQSDRAAARSPSTPYIKNARARGPMVMSARVVIGFAIIAIGLQQAEARSFVGATSRTVGGNAGIATMSRLCDARYPGSRVCTSSEYLYSVHPAKTPKAHGPAWIQAAPTAWIGADQSAMDISGFRLEPGYMNCFGWSNAAVMGLTVTGSGQFAQAVCSQVLSVTCCK